MTFSMNIDHLLHLDNQGDGWTPLPIQCRDAPEILDAFIPNSANCMNKPLRALKSFWELHQRRFSFFFFLFFERFLILLASGTVSL